MISRILKVPKDVSNTGYVRVVSDATNSKSSKHNSFALNYDYIVVTHDPLEQKTVGRSFEATREEVAEWESIKV